MNFRGVVDETTDITDPVIGDVVIIRDSGIEYVYDGSAWQEFGDASGNSEAIGGLDERLDVLEDTTIPDLTNRMKNAEDRLTAIDGTAETTLKSRIVVLEEGHST
jgi:hypothetical protein